jgi:hypothetical protein
VRLETLTGTLAVLVLMLGVLALDMAAPAPSPEPVVEVQAVPMAPAVAVEPPPVPEPEPEPDPLPTPPDSRAAFEERYPAQASAERAAGPEDDHWALLIGINEHLGAVSNNYVSREDAELLRELLLASGWDDERIVLMTDTDATGEMVREGLSWLARKAGDDATVLLHYSGHSKKWYGDGGAILDIALWPTDDDFVRADELADALEAVPHRRLWGNLATCNAEGFHAAGLGDERRLWTYSSATHEKSYEDPDAGHSVWGSFLVDEALWQGHQAQGDAGAIQDAFERAAPRAHDRTATQRYGPQTPVLVDGLGEPFHLDVTRVAAEVH